MQNRFGLKDFVIIVLLVLIGVSVWLEMFRRDRQWNLIQDVKSKVTDVERQVAQVRAKVDSGPEGGALEQIQGQLSALAAKIDSGVRVAAGGSAGGAGQPAAQPGATTPSGRDESWARPGVKVEWQPPYRHATDARQQPGYQVGGEFTQIFEAQPAKMTPFIQTDVYGRRAVDLVMEGMATYDPQTLKLKGVLAEAWQVDPEGKWVRVKIRDNARFSDGQPVTAEDVRWTFHDFIMNPQIEAQRQRSIVDTWDRVEVVSERVVDFFFKEIYYANTEGALTMHVMPKHVYSPMTPAQLNQATGLLVGSGPFKLERLDVNRQWAPPEPIVLVRNEQYWGPRPALDRIRFKAINEELARLTEYKNDEADMITPSAPQFISSAEDKDFATSNQLLNWVNMRSGRAGLIWNCDRRPAGPSGRPTPFGDARVRLAMTLLLDREKMVRDIWKNVGKVAKGFFNPGTPGDDPAVQPWPFDFRRGMELLKEAGWEDRNGDRQLEDKGGNPFVFELTYPSGSEVFERAATFIKDSYAAAGIRVTMRPMDWSVLDPVRDQRDFDCMWSGWGANSPEGDPKQIFHSSSIENQGDNMGQWRSAEADAAIDAARRELDPEKRAALWRKFEAVKHREQPYTWVRVAPELRFVKPWIGNVQTYPKGLETHEFFRGGADSLSPGK